MQKLDTRQFESRTERFCTARSSGLRFSPQNFGLPTHTKGQAKKFLFLSSVILTLEFSRSPRSFHHQGQGHLNWRRIRLIPILFAARHRILQRPFYRISGFSSQGQLIHFTFRFYLRGDWQLKKRVSIPILLAGNSHRYHNARGTVPLHW
jgi:hypothetical protein